MNPSLTLTFIRRVRRTALTLRLAPVFMIIDILFCLLQKKCQQTDQILREIQAWAVPQSTQYNIKYCHLSNAFAAPKLTIVRSVQRYWNGKNKSLFFVCFSIHWRDRKMSSPKDSPHYCIGHVQCPWNFYAFPRFKIFKCSPIYSSLSSCWFILFNNECSLHKQNIQSYCFILKHHTWATETTVSYIFEYFIKPLFKLFNMSRYINIRN